MSYIAFIAKRIGGRGAVRSGLSAREKAVHSSPASPRARAGSFVSPAGLRFAGSWAGPMRAAVAVLDAPAPPRSTPSASASARSNRLVAIDIGRSGALALYVGGELVDIADMPTLDDGPACRPTVNGPLLAALIRRWAPSEAVVEHVSARPGEAPSGAFAFGRSRGVIEGVLAGQAVPVRFVTPAWWKRRAGIPAGAGMKDLARSVAIARWPDRAELFARKLDHDRAEAVLIGLAYIEEKNR